MKYCVMDFETNTLKSYKRVANPFDQRNNIVLSVSKYGADNDVTFHYEAKGTRDPHIDWTRFDTIVGHNIKFDLSYIWHLEEVQLWLRSGGRIFDSMVAEYMLSAQSHSYPSLNDVSQKYGGSLKDDRIKEYWEAGLDTNDIPEQLLIEYGKYDVLNTELVFLSQLEQLRKRGMEKLFWGYMDHYAAMIEMEYNGLYLDIEKAHELRIELEANLKLIEANLEDLAREVAPNLEFNPSSPKQVGLLLFGGSYSVFTNEPILDENHEAVVYGPKAAKAGQIKMKKVETVNHIRTQEALCAVEVGSEFKTTDEKNLVRLLAWLKKKGVGPKAKNFIEKLLEYRGTTKLISTYIYGEKASGEKSGLIPLAMPQDSCVHHTLDCVQTVTGRLNSRNPNCQNLPPKIRELFRSRFEEGKILEFDFSQLEVCVQAYLSQSDSMIQHIKEGVDFHCKRLAYAEELSYEQVIKNLEEYPEVWGAKRKAAKTVSFQKAYGAQPESISEQTGLPVDVVRKIFDAEDYEYPEIKRFNEEVQNSALNTRVPTTAILPVRKKETREMVSEHYSLPRGIGYYTGITCRQYHFLEYGSISNALESSGRGVFKYFKPTEIANYIVQGTAADIVALSVGRVFRYLLTANSFGSVKLINEVHDSLVIDCKNSDCALVHKVKEILEDVDGTLTQYLGLKFNVPIQVEMKSGHYWRPDTEDI